MKGKRYMTEDNIRNLWDPASKMQVVKTPEKVGKNFEMLVITGSDHGSAETLFGKRRRADFLVRNLLGGT